MPIASRSSRNSDAWSAVVWFAEGYWQSKTEFPIFTVDSNRLNKDRLYPTNCTQRGDENLYWWVYQGDIPVELLKEIE